jgi:hypothetical protein
MPQPERALSHWAPIYVRGLFSSQSAVDEPTRWICFVEVVGNQTRGCFGRYGLLQHATIPEIDREAAFLEPNPGHIVVTMRLQVELAVATTGATDPSLLWLPVTRHCLLTIYHGIPGQPWLTRSGQQSRSLSPQGTCRTVKLDKAGVTTRMKRSAVGIQSA